MRGSKINQKVVLIGAQMCIRDRYDEEGDLIAIKNFSAKGKDDDLEMTFNIDDTF